MLMIHIHLPRSAEDDRTDLFFENLGKVSNFTAAQAQFFSARGSAPDIADSGQMTRTQLPYVNMIAFVYEPGLANQVITALRAALTATWPERDDIQAYEMVASSRRNLWSVRGGKSE